MLSMDAEWWLKALVVAILGGGGSVVAGIIGLFVRLNVYQRALEDHERQCSERWSNHFADHKDRRDEMIGRFESVYRHLETGGRT